MGFCLRTHLSPILLSTVIFTRKVMFTERWEKQVVIDLRNCLERPMSHWGTKSLNRKIFTKSAIGGSCCSSISSCTLSDSLFNLNNMGTYRHDTSLGLAPPQCRRGQRHQCSCTHNLCLNILSEPLCSPITSLMMHSYKHLLCWLLAHIFSRQK